MKYGAQLDYEGDEKSFTLEVMVTDASGMFSTENVIIILSDVNEPPLVSNEGLDNLAFPENSPAGCQIATVMASDPENDALHYSLTDGNEYFAIGADSGIIVTLDKEFDYESPNNTFHIVVVVSDGVSTPSPSVSFTINLTDVNEAPEFEAFDVAHIEENTVGGVYVLQLTATDPENDDVSYSLLAYNANFKVDEQTGNITTLSSVNLDYEDADLHILDVVVTDSKGASTTAQVQISVVNVLEPPKFIGTMQVFLNEDAAEGSQVMQLQALDPENDTFTFSLVTESR